MPRRACGRWRFLGRKSSKSSGLLRSLAPRAAVAVMSKAGLLVGGLPGPSINGERFTTMLSAKEHGGGSPKR